MRKIDICSQIRASCSGESERFIDGGAVCLEFAIAVEFVNSVFAKPSFPAALIFSSRFVHLPRAII